MSESKQGVPHHVDLVTGEVDDMITNDDWFNLAPVVSASASSLQLNARHVSVRFTYTGHAGDQPWNMSIHRALLLADLGSRDPYLFPDEKARAKIDNHLNNLSSKQLEQ